MEERFLFHRSKVGSSAFWVGSSDPGFVLASALLCSRISSPEIRVLEQPPGISRLAAWQPARKCRT